MNVTRVPFRHEGNSLFPLPADYNELTESGQRHARVNALRQWTLHTERGERESKALAFAECVDFFDSYYLTASDGFDPLFYRFHIPRAPFHYMMRQAYMLHRKVAGVAPRGSAKSTELCKEMAVCLLSQPMYEVLYSTSQHDLAENMGDRLKYQLYENPRIVRDWGPEYGGQVKPNRSEGRMGMDAFTLANRSAFAASSVQSRNRGRRPTKIVIDDPEWDPSGTTSLEDRREFMEWMLFHIAMPMVQTPDSGLVWWGTIVDRRLYLWHAMQTREVVEDGRVRHVAAERRFDGWFRIFIPAELPSPSGGVESFWPHLHPKDDAEKERMGLAPTTQTLPDVEKDLGPDTYAPEYLGKPRSDKAQYFPDLTEDQHGYWWEDPDESLYADPLRSRTKLCWKRATAKGLETVRVPLNEFCAKFHRFVCMDTAWTEKSSSDFKVNGCMAVTDQAELFLLDLWDGKPAQTIQAEEGLKMADRWRASLHPEIIDAGLNLCRDLEARVRMRVTDPGSIAFKPAVKGFRPGFTAKQDRINAALKWRFDHGQLKLPLRDIKPNTPWSRLKEQIVGFNPWLDGGGLEKDDHIDCCPPETPILCRRGWTPICEVTTDDFVATRAGWFPVHKAWCTGRKQVITRYGITATPTHPVWTENRGWVDLQDLVHCDIVLTCFEKPSSSMDSASIATRTPNGDTSAFISGLILAAKRLLFLSTSIFGREHMGLCRKVIAFITKTTIRPTTNCPISCASQQNSMPWSIKRSGVCEVEQQINSSCSLGCALDGRKVRSPAVTATRTTERSGQEEIGSAVRVLRRRKKKLCDATAKETGNRSTHHKDCETKTTAIESGTENTREQGGRSCETWNITVGGGGPPEFFANGVLVHNCLSMHTEVAGKGRAEPPPVQAKKMTPIEMLKEGIDVDEKGRRVAEMAQAMMTPDDVDEILAARAGLDDRNPDDPYFSGI